MTISTEQVIAVPAELNAPQSVEVDGKHALATLGPFDFPRYARVILKEYEDKTRFYVRLMYDVANDEEVDESIKRSGVVLGVGKQSGRVFSIMLTLKATAGDLGTYVARVHECLVDLQNKMIKNPKRYLIRRNAHYKMVDSFVPMIARQLEISAAG
jgi:hypothetical protein